MSGETFTKEPLLTQTELDEIAYFEAAEFAGYLAAKEASQSDDNYGGSLLHGSIPFAD